MTRNVSPFIEEKHIIEDENMAPEEKQKMIQQMWLDWDELERLREGRNKPCYYEHRNISKL